MDQYIGKLLDNRYEILEVIGTGGMAVVYKARCHRLNRLVAIKILREDLARDAEFRRRFHDESQAVAMLSHPNIMAVYDVSRSSEIEYIVMELIDGITLKQYIQKKGGPLNWREALHFITQIIKALSHAHGRGIIHRDIKPQNIMVLRDGSVKVADFGIARLASATQHTLTQEALGSVHYISPEQARGSRIDVRSDIYSAGVVLYEMLTDRLPYVGDTPVSVAIQHINSMPLSPKEHNAEVPEALESITLKAMASSIDHRYVNTEAMLADLEEFRKNPSINFDYTPADLCGAGFTDEPTQVIDTGRRRIQPPPVSPRKRDYDYEQEPERGYTNHRGSGAGSALLAVGVILLFIVGIGVFLWLTFFSNLFQPVAQEYSVPDLIGKTMEEIYEDRKLTEIFKLVEAETAVVSNHIPFGQVAIQDPKAGSMVKGEQLTITLTISAGESAITMPMVTNTEYRQARLELESLGLTVISPEFQTHESVTKGYVISTTPEVGTPVSAGSQVMIAVSLGPEIKKVTIPELTGQPLETVKKQLQTLGLTLGTVSPVKHEAPKDTVVGQSFSNMTEVAEGTTIHLQVSTGPDENATPAPIVTQTPQPTPSTAPTSTPAPTPAPTPSPAPSEAVAVPVTTKTISVDVSGDSTETIHLKVTCGETTFFDNQVQRVVQKVNVNVAGSGVQTVTIYVNNEEISSYSVDFEA